MTKDKQIKLLKSIITDIFWMARRYAHGRHTYAPSMVRDAYNIIKTNFPKLLPKKDYTLYSEVMTKGSIWEISDYLHDCND